MKDRELWMDKLRERLEEHSEPVPASGWEQLEKELMPSVEKRIYPYRRRMTAIAAVVLLALISSVSLYFLRTPSADDIRSTQVPALASAPDLQPASQQPETQTAKVEQIGRHNSGSISHIIAKATVTELSTGADVKVEQENGETVTASAKSNKGKDVMEVESKKQTETAQIASAENSHKPSGKDKLHIPVEKTSVKKGNWSMGLSVGNAGGTSGKDGGDSKVFASRVDFTLSDGAISIPGDQLLVFDNGIPYLQQIDELVEFEHHQPISFGLSLRKSLGRGFSIETGVTYTLLSSDAKMSGNNKKVNQKLHYIGIPLKGNWNFLDKKHFTLYVSGGGMVEKCVYGKRGNEEETVKPLQFSLNGAVGAQVNATKRIGVYVEPGVAYFFDDGSKVETIRKERPFNFNIQAGVRLTY